MSFASSFRVFRLGLLAVLAVALFAALGALQTARAQTPVMVTEPQQRIVIDDSDATVPTSAENLLFTVVLRFTVSTEIEDDDITAVSATFTDRSIRITRSIEQSTGTAATGKATCELAPDETLVWDCVVGTYSADLFGAQSGDYTISIRNDTAYSLTVTGANSGNAITGTLAAATATFRIADIVEVKSVTLEVAEDESASRAAGSDGIELVLKILNANNAAADPSAISSILVSGPPLKLASTAPGSSCSTSICQWSGNSAKLLGGRGAESIKITAESSTPASAEVTVRVLNAEGEAFEAKSPRLIFTGAASKLTLGTPSGTLLNEAIPGDRDEIRIEVTAADSSGNATEVSSGLSLTVRNPDGRTVSTSAISREQLDRDSSGRVFVKLTTKAGSDDALAVGEYTLRVSHSGASGEGKFRVAGKASAVSVATGEPVWESGAARVTMTADVTDAEGQAVADGTPVVFTVTPAGAVGSGGAQLVLVGRATVDTVSGRASATYLVVSAGRALVTATADSISGVQLVTVTDAAAAGDEPGPGLSGLGSLAPNSYASWISAATVRISELYEGLSARGVNAIFKWDRAAGRYVQYAEHSGEQLPGAVDFRVLRGDILWLGGGG